MGKYQPYPKTHPNHWNYLPDDGPDHFYLLEGATMMDIIDQAEAKWGNVLISQINIVPEHVHTYCIHYDLHDPGDYSNYLRIELIKE